jgi:hypothetical protein
MGLNWGMNRVNLYILRQKLFVIGIQITLNYVEIFQPGFARFLKERFGSELLRILKPQSAPLVKKEVWKSIKAD